MLRSTYIRMLIILENMDDSPPLTCISFSKLEEENCQYCHLGDQELLY